MFLQAARLLVVIFVQPQASAQKHNLWTRAICNGFRNMGGILNPLLRRCEGLRGHCAFPAPEVLIAEGPADSVFSSAVMPALWNEVAEAALSVEHRVVNLQLSWGSRCDS